MDNEALKLSGIDAHQQAPRHGPKPQPNTSSSSSPRPTHPTMDKASPKHLTSPTPSRRVSPLADFGTLISKSQLHRRISPQPPPTPDHQRIGPERRATGLSADQLKSRRATIGPDFLARLNPSQSHGTSNSMSDALDLYSSTIPRPAPTSATVPNPIRKPPQRSSRDVTPQHAALQPPEPNMFIPPLTPIHFHCYQAHRSMKRSSNIHAPVPCMACRVDDTETRWKCMWCCLRICGACMQRLEKVPGRDLKSVVQRLERGRRRSQAY